MSVAVQVETAKRELDTLLDRLPMGETITLVGPNGTPQALIVKLQQASMDLNPAAPSGDEPPEDWFSRWDDLARRIDAVWSSDKSIVDSLIEMRR